MDRGKLWTFDKALTVGSGVAGLVFTAVGTWFAVATYYRDQPAAPPAPAAESAIMPPWWAIALLGMGFVLLAAQLVVGVARWHKRRIDNDLVNDPKWLERLEKVVGRTFMNSTVPMDGKHYISCKFQHVTFLYNGGPFALEHCEIGVGITFKTENPQIRRAAEFLVHIGIAKTNILSDKGLMSHEEYLARGGNKTYDPSKEKPTS